MQHAIVTGGASGLGQAIVAALIAHEFEVTVWDVAARPKVDVADHTAVMQAAARYTAPLDVLVNCAAVNYIDWIEDLHPKDFNRVMQVNACGILNCTQAVMAKLYGGGTVCNIISNAAHVPMNASLAYNASKAAAEMMTRQMAHELGPRHGITVFGLSPNKLAGASEMSRYTAQRVAQVRGWSPEQVSKAQNASLPTGKATPTELPAEFLAWLLAQKDRHKYLQGCILTYGGPT